MGVQFATPDKHDSIVAVARNADRGIEVVLGSVLDDEKPGNPATTGNAAPTVIDSASEGAKAAGSVTFEQNADDDNTDDDPGGSE
jgi:DNA gyrase subunit A